MAYHHPIGDDHPFPQVHALAQREGFDQLEIVNLYDGALIRLFVGTPNIVFRLDGDPGSALDRQRFDYWTKIVLTPASPQDLLKAIKSHLAQESD
ncbi:hypothetical protein [uncultured Pelagimonas sp.]|uniref:hypothetical protein n=1 Tax=uncultured Pelagimonas sp. TaxID=1618102 RepID=UPI00260E40EA|nr:hypothetical protein [uncultured Pelagimonas sp.]